MLSHISGDGEGREMTNVFLEMKSTGAKKKKKEKLKTTTNKEREIVQSIKLSERDFPTVICSLILLRPECFRLLMSFAVKNTMYYQEVCFFKPQSVLF